MVREVPSRESTFEMRPKHQKDKNVKSGKRTFQAKRTVRLMALM